MPTPIFTVRLAEETQRDLARISAVYGAPNVRAFAREVLEVIASGEESRVRSVLGRLFERVTGQLELQVDTAAKGNAAPRLTKRPRKGKSRRGRDRTT